MRISAEFFISVSGGILVSGSSSDILTGASVDSRTLRKDDWFFACPGAHLLGISFVKDAYAKGAKGFVISKNDVEVFLSYGLIDVVCIAVENVISSLYVVALAWRDKINFPVVAITGSVGKTTTKEFLRSFFNESSVNAYVSRENQNTHIGVALNMISMSCNMDIGVFEVGISKTGEMEKIIKMLQPTVAVLTGVHESHLHGLGSLNGILKEKVKVFSSSSIESVIVASDIYSDAESLIPGACKKITFGFNDFADVSAVIKESIGISVFGKKFEIVNHFIHKGIVKSFLASCAVASMYLKFSNKLLKKVFEVRKIGGRFNIEFIENMMIVDDAYNANPESMICALQAFDSIDWSGEKVAVVADMLELGVDSIVLHEDIAMNILNLSTISRVVCVGPLMKHVYDILKNNIKCQWYCSAEEANMEMYCESDCAILYKGSRGMRLDSMIKKIKLNKKIMVCNECISSRNGFKKRSY